MKNLDIEIEYKENEVKDIDKLFEAIERTAKEAFEKLGLEVQHIRVKTK